MMYQHIDDDHIKRISDGSIIPADPSNADYCAYLEWVEAGGETQAAADPEEYPIEVPSVVSRFQARVALFNAGLFDQVEAIMSEPETQFVVVEAWRSAQEFRRDSPTIAAMAQMLNLDDEQIDGLFIEASSIQA